jgi:hypothetical protein
MACILVIPHSNCDCERVFSSVRKNKTDFRKRMTPHMVESLLQVKQNSLGPCFERKYSEDFLKRAKCATYLGLQKNTNQNAAAVTVDSNSE